MRYRPQYAVTGAFLLMTATSGLAQTSAMPPVYAPLAAAVVPAVPQVEHALIRQDTPVELMATKEVNGDIVTTGTRFTLRLNKAIMIGGKLLIPVGATAYAEVTDAVDSDAGGIGGSVSAKLLYLVQGATRIPLSGTIHNEGAETSGVATALTGVYGLFHHGKAGKIKAGQLVSGFVAVAVALDLPPTPEAPAAATVPPPGRH